MSLDNLNFDFMGRRKLAAGISATLVLLSLISLAINQVEWGLDFTGGTLVEVSYSQPADPEGIRRELDDAGYDGHVVQYFGTDKDILVHPTAEGP